MKTGLYNIVLILVFIPLIYFMLIRPQRKRDKEVTSMRAALKPGDNIVTIGGIVGKIVRIKDDRILIETGSGKTKKKKLSLQKRHMLTDPRRLLQRSLELKKLIARKTLKRMQNNYSLRCACCTPFFVFLQKDYLN